MATATRTDPFIGNRFRLEISGIQIAGFSEVTIPDLSIAEVDYREGTDAGTRKLSGQSSIGTLTLKRGQTSSTELYDWFTDIMASGALLNLRKSVSVVLVDPTGVEKARWNCTKAWPSKYESGALDAKGSEVLIETLEIQVEGMTRSQ